MTHTLHRYGNRESLRNDYVWLFYPAAKVPVDNLVEKTARTIDIVESCGCVNWGDVKTAIVLEMPPEDIRSRLRQDSRIRGVFTDKSQVIQFLKRMKEADFGVPVIISGVVEDAIDACKQAGLRPHTINFSLGIWGKKELLPSPEVLSLTTMCGHHMISPGFAQKVIDEVKAGRSTPREAALKLAPFCRCGIFNQVRAEAILREIANEDKSSASPQDSDGEKTTAGVAGDGR